MSKSSMTVRDVFELPEPGADKSRGWQTFEERVSKEVKGIKTAALADIAEKVAELFEIPIPDIFVSSWKKADGIKALLEESRKSPDTVMNTELGEHTINSQHRPHIEVRIQNKSVKKIEFTLKLVFNLKGFVLKIQDGLIRGMQTGVCDVKGKLEFQGMVIAEKKLAPITLPGTLSFQAARIEREKQFSKPVEEKPAATIVAPVLDAAIAAEKPAEPGAAASKVSSLNTIEGVPADLAPTSAAPEKIDAIDHKQVGDLETAQAQDHEPIVKMEVRPSQTDVVQQQEARIVEEVGDLAPPGLAEAPPPESATAKSSSVTGFPEVSAEGRPAVSENGDVAAIKAPESISTKLQQDSSTAEEEDERMVWEVGD